jgi:SpoVK/Ycf46/Vps4 family AAA+-type ATPase
MPVSYNTFERLKDRGLAAFKAGDYKAAKPYLMQAADAIIKIAAESDSPAQRSRRKAMAAELIEFAKSCDKQAEVKKKHRTAARDGDEQTTDAADWIVREKPGISFDDIAGLDDVKHEIRLKMIYPFSHPELAERYRISVGGGVLLYGPPGTGKTMIAKAIAREIDARGGAEYPQAVRGGEGGGEGYYLHRRDRGAGSGPAGLQQQRDDAGCAADPAGD